MFITLILPFLCSIGTLHIMTNVILKLHLTNLYSKVQTHLSIDNSETTTKNKIEGKSYNLILYITYEIQTNTVRITTYIHQQVQCSIQTTE